MNILSQPIILQQSDYNVSTNTSLHLDSSTQVQLYTFSINIWQLQT